MNVILVKRSDRDFQKHLKLGGGKYENFDEFYDEKTLRLNGFSDKFNFHHAGC